ncbi:MAG TPA: hypothetical protein VIL74_12685 [Pyrinomonadaceae bacterium]|jgi:hypothetical protein
MKRKIMIALTVVFALSLALTVYALNKTNVSPKRAAGTDCCAKKDSCPMKSGAGNAEKASCCDKDDCCCKGDSCPMKMNGEKTEGKDCCGKGGDSCPMKNPDEKQTTAGLDMTNVTVASGESCCQPGADCCKSGSCCKGKHS